MKTALALLRTSVMTALQYRSDFVFQAVTGALRSAASIAPLLLVYSHVGVLAGWTPADATLVMALFLLLGAFHAGVMEPNLGEVVEAIRQGTLDLWLLKPADAQLIVSLRRIDPAYLWDVLAAIILGTWALAHRATPPTPVDGIVAGALVVCGLAAMYGLWILAICTSFFFVQVDNLRYLLTSIADAGRWPLGVYGPILRFVLTVIIPVGLITTFPANALRGAWNGYTVLVAMLVSVGFLAVSRLAWQRSLRWYSSASS